MKRIRWSALLLAVLFTSSTVAHAWIVPAVSITARFAMWAVRTAAPGDAVLLGDAVVGYVSVGSVLLSLFGGDSATKPLDGTWGHIGDAGGPSGNLKANVVVSLKSGQKRTNPDSSTWDDAVGANIDPTPKTVSSEPAIFSGISGTSGLLDTSYGNNNYVFLESDFPIYQPWYNDLAGIATKYMNTDGDVQYETAYVTQTAAYDGSVSNSSLLAIRYDGQITISKGSWDAMVAGGYVPVRVDTLATNAPLWEYAPNGSGGYAYVNVRQVDRLKVVFQRAVRVCAQGYTYESAGQRCLPKSLEKPATTPCEVVFHRGSWKTDSLNPNCQVVAGSVAIAGRTVQLNVDSDYRVQITKLEDGSYVIDEIKDGQWRRMETTVEDADGGAKVLTVQTGSESSGSGNFMGITPIAGGGSSSGGGSGSGGGSAGSGSGSCGGTDQPKCGVSVDDSGFLGRSNFSGQLDAVENKYGERQAAIGKAGTEPGNPRPVGSNSWTDWLPRPWPTEAVACKPIKWDFHIDHGPLKDFAHTQEVDLCDKFGLIREWVGWFYVVAGAVYLWGSFRRSNSGD